MKKLYLLFLLTILAMVAYGQTSKTINVETAGTLPTLISDDEKYTIEELTLTGNLNGTDFRLLRDMAGNNYLGQKTEGKLKVLDLSGANIVAGGDPYLETDKISGDGFSSSYSKKLICTIDQANTLSNYIFVGCTFSTIYMPSSLKCIGDFAFHFCTQVTSLVIPEGVETIGSHAFMGCRRISLLELPSTLVSVGDGVVKVCEGLNAIVSHISNPIQVGEHTFDDTKWDSSSQTSIEIPSYSTLYVPIGSKSKYEAINGWTKFAKIEEGDAKGIVFDGLNFIYATGLKTATVVDGDYSGLKSVTIPASITVDGMDYKVTAIGNKAFDECNNIKSVTINAALELICNYAFRYVRMTNLVLPSSLKSIGDNAFWECQQLTSLVIPEGVETIGQSAFSGCIQLQNLELPSTLVSMGDEAFSRSTSLKAVVSHMTTPVQVGEHIFMSSTWDQSSQTTIWSPSSATLYIPVGSRSKYEAIIGWTKFAKIIEKAVVDGLTYNCSSESKTATVISGDYYGLESVTIPASITIDGIDYKVTTIGENAFKSCGKLTSLVIPEGIETIGDRAFEGCSSLLRLELSSTLVSIGDRAFAKLRSLNAVVSHMTNPIQVGEQTFTNSQWDETSSTYIDTPSSATLYVPVGSKSKYEAIPGWTKFAKIEEGEANVAVVDGLNYIYAIGSKTATVVDGDYSGLEHVTIPASITVDGVDYKVMAIGSEAFGGCNNIKSITFNAALETIGNYAFSSVSVTELVLPSSLKSIGNGAFSSCKQLTSLVIPEGVEAIGDGAFSSCGIQRLWLPSTLLSIGKEAFSRSTSLNAISSRMTTPIQVGEHAFLFPFREADGETISWVSLYVTLCVPLGSKSKYEAIPGWTKYKKIEEGELIVKDGLNYCYSTDSKTAKLIFSGYPDLKNITIPASITVDGVDYNVTAIGEKAFISSSKLTSLVIPEGVETIGDYAFESCSSLLHLELPSTLVSIGEEAFSGCSSLNVVVSRMTNPIQVGEHTFMISKYDNSSKTYIWNPSPATLYVPADSKSKYEAITGWTKFAQIEEGEVIVVNVLNYGYSTDSKTATLVSGDYSILESVTIPASITVDGQSYEVTAIGDCAFQNNELVVKVTIPETIASIGAKAFAGCTNLKSIYIYVKTPINLSEVAASRTRGDGGSSVFSGVDTETCVLYVPAGSADAYRNADGWKDFKNIVEIPASASIKVAKGMTTYTSQYNLDFSGFGDDVKAYVATGYDYDKNTIWLTRVKDVPAGTPILVQAPASDTPYDIPVKASSGCYYKNMLVGNLSGAEITLSATTGDMTNYYLSNGMFLTATGSNTIGNGKAYLQIPTTPPAATVGSSQAVKLNDYGFASFCGSQDLDFTDVEGLKAFAVTGYDDANGTIWLTRVNRVSAQTPLLLKGESKGSYSVPSVAVGSYYANMLKGNLSGSTITIYATDGDMTNYYLKGNQLLKATDGGNTIGNGKAYMQIPSKHVTRSMEDIVADLLIYGISDNEPEVISIPVVNIRGLNGDGTTNIHEKLAPEQTNDVYYNLQGQRVDNPTKGLYIKNGRKVVIK